MNAVIDVSKVELETERLILRAFRQEDLDDFFAYASVTGVGEMAGWKHHQSKAETQEVLDLFIKEKKTFALVLKENNQVVGSLGLEMVQERLDHVMKQLKGRQLGFVLAKEHWGKGLMPEAVSRVIAYCFTELDLDFLSCGYFLDNVQSAKVQKKMGFLPYQITETLTQDNRRIKVQINCLMNPKHQRIEADGPIAVFDSGMGGISVLKRLHDLMPNEDYLFFGDSLHAPYGKKQREEIVQLTLDACEYLMNQGAKAIVIACNTATSAAIEQVRRIFPVPVIGIEPSFNNLIPVTEKKQRIVVMATPFTLSAERYESVKRESLDHLEIIDVPAPVLVQFVEKDELDSPQLHDYLHHLLDPLMNEPIDGIILGCTHFPFVAKAIRKIVGSEVRFYDGSILSAKRTRRQLRAVGLLKESNTAGRIRFENSEPSGSQKELSKQLFNKKIENF